MIAAAGMIDARRSRILHQQGWLDTWPAFALLCLAATVPLLAVGVPPLVDLYGHLGRYAIQTDLANRPELQPYYSFEWRLIGNLGADLLVEALHGWLGIETAVRVIVIATQLLAAAGVLLVSRAVHGRVTPFAVAALPLIYGLPFNYGFLNFSLSMALAMLTFAAWLRLRRSAGDVAPRVWLAATGLVIWLCHAYGWAFLGLLCGSIMLAGTIAEKRRPVPAIGRILGACWPLLLPLVPMILWRAESGGMDIDTSTLMFKLEGLMTPLRTRWPLIDVPSLFVVVALIYWALRNPRVKLERGLGIAALLCFAFFLILPKYVFGSAGADVRLMPYALLMGLLAIPSDAIERKTLRLLTVLALSFFAVRMVTTAAAYARYESAVEEVLPTLDSLPRGSRVAFLSVARCEPTWELPVLDHVAGYALLRRSAFVNDQWHIRGVSPLGIHHPAAGTFAYDPSHLALADGCYRDFYPSLSEVFARMPYKAFTHVWMVGALPDPLTVPATLEPVPHAGKGALFAIKPAR